MEAKIVSSLSVSLPPVNMAVHASYNSARRPVDVHSAMLDPSVKQVCVKQWGQQIGEVFVGIVLLMINNNNNIVFYSVFKKVLIALALIIKSL